MNNILKQPMTSINTINTLVSNIVQSKTTQDLLHAHGLTAYKIAWEDTGRSKNSCLGPNISDMSLLARGTSESRYESADALMPVIRRPNFSDVTDDVPIDAFKVNYKGSLVTLEQLLKDLGVYDKRDSVVLTSSQCCILPVELGRKTQFAVQLFNYQSSRSKPAVLTILASKNGTSVQVLDSANTKLFFDDHGTARWFSAERLEDVRIRQNVVKTKVDSFNEMTNEEKLDNSLMMIQVPLFVQKTRSYQCMGSSEEYESTEESCSLGRKQFRGMDMAQLGLGDSEGPYCGIRGVTLKRDANFPVRCTFQYYRVTDSGTIDEKDIIDIKEQLDQSHKIAVGHGSLVLNTASGRVTEPVLPANANSSSASASASAVWAGTNPQAKNQMASFV